MKVLVPGALRSYTRELHVQADGDTLSALFDDFERRYPGLRFRVVELGHALQPDDFVAVVLALGGG